MNKFTPNNYKYKKIHKKVRFSGLKDFRTHTLKTYSYGLKVLDNALISSVVFEAARRSITRKMKKTGKLKINGFANIPVTSKPIGVRMGKGVGSIDQWVFPVKKGRILFEIDGVSLDLAKSALRSAAFKLPVKSKFICKV